MQRTVKLSLQEHVSTFFSRVFKEYKNENWVQVDTSPISPITERSSLKDINYKNEFGNTLFL